MGVHSPLLPGEIASDDEPPLAHDIYFSSHRNIRLQPSGEKGLGLFVFGAPIKAGEPVWWCDPETHPTGKVWNLQELEALEPDSDWFWHWAYRCGENLWLGPRDKDDPSKEATYYQNHSCDPSTWWSSPYILTARRDLEIGDEITYDYGTSECDEEELGMEHCLCGSALCRDQITGNDYLLPELAERYGPHFQPYLLERQHQLGLNLDSTPLPPMSPDNFYSRFKAPQGAWPKTG